MCQSTQGKRPFIRLACTCLLACLLALLPLSALAKSAPKEPAQLSLSLAPEGTTGVAVTWAGADRVQLRYAVEGQSRELTKTLRKSPIVIEDLAPQTTYVFTITDDKSGATAQEAITLLDPGPYRTHGYRWNLCKFYFMEDDDNADSFFDLNRRRTFTTSDAHIKTNIDSHFYTIILEATWKKTAELKEWEELIVMRTPSGDVFTYPKKNDCDPTWDGFYSAYPLNDLFRKYMRTNDAWETGVYAFELYFDGQFAGRTQMELE